MNDTVIYGFLFIPVNKILSLIGAAAAAKKVRAERLRFLYYW